MPLVTIKLYEGRTDAQKKAVADGIIDVLLRELGGAPEHSWIVFEDRSRDDWFVGRNSQTEIDEMRKNKADASHD